MKLFIFNTRGFFNEEKFHENFVWNFTEKNCQVRLLRNTLILKKNDAEKNFATFANKFLIFWNPLLSNFLKFLPQLSSRYIEKIK